MNTLPSQTEHFLVNTLLLQDHVIVPSPQILRLLESELSSNYLINSAPLYLSIVFYILDGLLELFHTIAVLPLKRIGYRDSRREMSSTLTFLCTATPA